jgi:hypothetical protein
MSSPYFFFALAVNNIMVKRDGSNHVVGVKLVDFNGAIDLGPVGHAAAQAWVAAESVTPPEVHSPCPIA